MKLATAAIIGCSSSGIRLPSDAGKTWSYFRVWQPVGIVGSGTATEWRDNSGNGGTITASGAPVITSMTSNGVVTKGVLMDGINDWFDGPAVLAADAPMTIFILCQPMAQASARYTIIEFSDTGASDRGTVASMVFTNRTSHQGELGDPGNAGYVDATVTPELYRHDYTLLDRAVLAGGLPRVGAAVPLPSPRTSIATRIGAALSGLNLWNAILCSIVVCVGPMDYLDKEEVQEAIQTYAGLPLTPRWPQNQTSIGGDDPQILLQDTIASLGSVIIMKDTVHCLSTAAQPLRDGQIAQTISNPGGGLTIVDGVDRWTITSSPGDATVQLVEGAFSATATIHTVAPLSGGASARNVVFIGDSNTSRAWFVQYIGDALQPHATMLGTMGPNAGYSYKHEGHDGFGYDTFNSGATVQGTTSPMWNAGALDIANYETLLGAPVHRAIWALGSNIGAFNDANLEALIDIQIANAEILFAAFRAQWPTVQQYIWTPPPGNGDPLVWGSESSRLMRRRAMHRVAQRMYAAFRNREAEGLHVVPMTYQFDPWRGYPGPGFPGADPIHMLATPGHYQIGNMGLAALTAGWSL